MGIAEMVAFFKALPLLVKLMEDLVSSVRELRQDAINRELDSIKKDVETRILTLTMSRTDEERKLALVALCKSIGK